jgi:aspartate/methionine/tyrosine aminotransferase
MDYETPQFYRVMQYAPSRGLHPLKEYIAARHGVSEDRIVATNAVSKSMAITGFRVGYAVFPPTDGPTGRLLEHATTRHMLTNVSGSRPAQYAVQRAIETTDSSYYEGARDRLRARIETFCGALDAVGAVYTRPDGGFYVLVRFPEFRGHSRTRTGPSTRPASLGCPARPSGRPGPTRCGSR